MGRSAGLGKPPPITPPRVVFCLLNTKALEGNYRIGVTHAAYRWHAGVPATVPSGPSPP